MALPNYAYYTGTYLGTAIASGDFNRLALRANEDVDRLTFGRSTETVTANTDAATIDLINRAICAVAEQIQTLETGDQNIASERVGSVSITYTRKTERSGGDDDIDLRRAAARHLRSTGLLYPGFYSDELGTSDWTDEDVN